MGILPTGSGDWLQFETRGEASFNWILSLILALIFS